MFNWAETNLPNDIFKIMSKGWVFAIRWIRIPEAGESPLLVKMMWISKSFFRQTKSTLNLTDSYLIANRRLQA